MSIFYKKIYKNLLEAKICTKLPPETGQKQGVISCKFLPPPNFYVFSYKNGLNCVIEKNSKILLFQTVASIILIVWHFSKSTWSKWCNPCILGLLAIWYTLSPRIHTCVVSRLAFTYEWVAKRHEYLAAKIRDNMYYVETMVFDLF